MVKAVNENDSAPFEVFETIDGDQIQLDISSAALEPFGFKPGEKFINIHPTFGIHGEITEVVGVAEVDNGKGRSYPTVFYRKDHDARVCYGGFLARGSIASSEVPIDETELRGFSEKSIRDCMNDADIENSRDLTRKLFQERIRKN